MSRVYRRKSSGPQRLEQVLSRESLRGPRIRVADLRRVFAAVVGSDTTQDSAVLGVWGGKLVLAIRSKEVRKRIEPHQRYLVEMIGRECKVAVTKVKYVVKPDLYPTLPPEAPQTSVKATSMLDPETLAAVEAIAKNVEDPGLRAQATEWMAGALKKHQELE